MASSLNQQLAEELLRVLRMCDPDSQPSAHLLQALKESIHETTKAGAFEQLEAKVEALQADVRSLKNNEALRSPRARV